jgi:glycine/D-amino acid oxidase-like deaminating enzyme
MLRLFRSPEQQRFYHRRCDDPQATQLLGEMFSSQDCPEPISAPHGGFVQYQTGHVDLPLLLSLIRDWLCAKDSLITREFDAAALDTNERGVRFGNWRAKHAVFCEGHRLLDNPWFDHLPLQPDKGEILTVRSETWQPRHIINGAHWLLPQPPGLIRFGATHGHQDANPNVTDGARKTLLDGLHVIAPTHRFSLVDHQAGFRPATPDRYPFLGRSRRHPSVWVCNGFGARGALSIPWYTTRLVSHLIEQRPLPAEADIERLQ